MLGYAVYLLLIILPGFTISQLLRLRTRSLSCKISTAISLGISFLIVFLSLTQAIFNGLNEKHLYFIIIVFAFTLLILLRNSSENFTSSYDNYDAIIFLIYIGYLGFLWLHFLRFPIFPNSSSGDFIFHLKSSLKLIEGEKNIVNLGYYPGIELLLGSGILVVKGENLIVMRHLMSLLTAFMPLMVYNAAHNYFDDRKKGIICALLFAFSAIFWYDSLYISGLYANLLTNLITISSLSLIYQSVNEKNPRYYFAILLSGASLVLSHSTSIIFMITAWIFMIIIKVRNQELLKKYARSVTLLSVPFLGVFFYPKILSRLSNILSGQFVAIEFGDPVFNLLRPVSPFIAYMSGYMGIAVVSIILTGFFYLIVEYKNKDLWRSYFPLWFLFIWVLSLQGRQVWRFALLAKTPSIFLIGYLVGEVLNALEGISEGYLRPFNARPFNANGVSALLLVVVLISGGALNYTFSNLAYRENAQRQKEIFESFKWVSENTENNSKIVVLSEWEYIYLPQLTSRESYHVSIAGNYNITEIKEMAETFADYIIVSSGLQEVFKESGVFEETWNNDIVTIFSVSR